MTKKLAALLIAILLFHPSLWACKCTKFKSTADMFSKADLVFFGSRDEETKNSGAAFKIERFAKGPQELFGSPRLFLAWAKDVPDLCRGHIAMESELVFAVKTDRGYSFLTDCYADAVVVQNNQYVYKGEAHSDFDFFKVNPLSAVNGLRPKYASEISEADARKLAEDAFWRNPEIKKNHAKDRDHWKSTEAQKLDDKLGQEYWNVRIAYIPPRAKGELYVLRFYNSLPESFQISPGE